MPIGERWYWPACWSTPPPQGVEQTLHDDWRCYICNAFPWFFVVAVAVCPELWPNGWSCLCRSMLAVWVPAWKKKTFFEPPVLSPAALFFFFPSPPLVLFSRSNLSTNAHREHVLLIGFDVVFWWGDEGVSPLIDKYQRQSKRTFTPLSSIPHIVFTSHIHKNLIYSFLQTPSFFTIFSTLFTSIPSILAQNA